MLRNIQDLQRVLDRVSRPRSATITPTPGGPAVWVRVGDEVELVYRGERRRVCVLAVTATGIRCWDCDKLAIRSFKFTKIGVAERPPETDAATQG